MGIRIVLLGRVFFKESVSYSSSQSTDFGHAQIILTGALLITGWYELN